MRRDCGEKPREDYADIRDILRAVRENLRLDVAFVSQFVGSTQVLRYVDSAEPDCPVREGAASEREEGYCQRVIDGRLPALILDASALPEAAALPVTRTLPVGSHLSVPIRLSNGKLYGTFCCFSHVSRPTLDERDLASLRAFADLAAERIEKEFLLNGLRSAREQRIRALLATGGPSIVYQPVYLLDRMRLAGSEALSRFPCDAGYPVEAWFRDAAEAGLQADLELAAIRNALAGYRDVWRAAPIQVGLNASAAAILDPRFESLFEAYPKELIVIELTEHEEVCDYVPLTAALHRLRASGMKLAIDDVGAGYASLRHILELRPNILKLDLKMVRGIDGDEVRQGLVAALKAFADGFGSRIVAEGVETRAELEVLRGIGMQAVQGFLLGRPQPVRDFLRTVRRPLRMAG